MSDPFQVVRRRPGVGPRCLDTWSAEVTKGDAVQFKRVNWDGWKYLPGVERLAMSGGDHLIFFAAKLFTSLAIQGPKDRHQIATAVRPWIIGKTVERRRCGTKSHFKAKSTGPTGLNFIRGFDPRPYGRGYRMPHLRRCLMRNRIDHPLGPAVESRSNSQLHALVRLTPLASRLRLTQNR